MNRPILHIPQVQQEENQEVQEEQEEQQEQNQEEQQQEIEAKMIRLHIQCELSFGEMKIDQPVPLLTPFKFLAEHLQQLLSNQYNQSCQYIYNINGKSIKSQEIKVLAELGVKDGDYLIMKKKT